MTEIQILLAFELVVLLIALNQCLIERRAQNWTRVRVHTVETRPQSLLERAGTSLTLNLDSDHVLVYRFEGNSYRVRLGDEANVNIMGVKIWRKTPRIGEGWVYVNPLRPKQYFDPRTEGHWRYTVAFAAAVPMLVLLLKSV